MNDAPPIVRPPKFKHTRDLVRIALSDGMTQEEIARLCRTEQSVVSGWASGKVKAREGVLQPLIKRYAHRLNRTTSRVYLIRETPELPWEETRRGKLLTRLQEDPRGYVMEHATAEAVEADLDRHVKSRVKASASSDASGTASNNASGRSVGSEDTAYGDEDLEPIAAAESSEAEQRVDWANTTVVAEAVKTIAIEIGAGQIRTVHRHDRLRMLAQIDRETFVCGATRVVRVEGPIIWRHTRGEPRRVLRRVGRHADEAVVELVPVARWLLHALGDGRFRLVVQALRELHGVDRVLWAQLPVYEEEQRQHREPSHRILTDDDSARWISALHGPFDVSGVIDDIDKRLRAAGPHDRAVVPFTLRKALVEHGYDVPDVEFISVL